MFQKTGIHLIFWNIERGNFTLAKARRRKEGYSLTQRMEKPLAR